MRLANALLGAAQIEAMLAESLAGDSDALFAAHRQQLLAAGVADDAEKLAAFLRWQTLRVSGPLPVAAAHAADGLHRLLGVIGNG